MLKFLFSNETDVAISKTVFVEIVAKFEKVLKMKVEKTLNCQKGEISLTLVDDRKIQALNCDYRGKNTPTDVLSFAYIEDEKTNITHGSAIQVGDIFISTDTTKRQAKDHKHSLEKELSILFVHGLLHLFGFDHNNDKEEAEMEKRAKKIL